MKMRQPAPALSVSTLSGSAWTLADAKPSHFTMLVFYRGVHCPVCRKYLLEIQSKLEALAALGTEVIAISVDTLERATKSKVEWGLDRLTVGYGMTIETARNWDLFVSAAQNDQQLPLFSEPALFLIEPNGALYYASITSAPWGRPQMDEMLIGIKRCIDMKVMARGEA